MNSYNRLPCNIINRKLIITFTLFNYNKDSGELQFGKQGLLSHFRKNNDDKKFINNIINDVENTPGLSLEDFADKNQLDSYAKEYKNVADSTKEMVQNLAESGGTIDDLKKKANGLGGTFKNIGGIAKGILGSIGATMLNMGITAVASLAVTGITKLVDGLITTKKEIAEARKAAIDAGEKAKSELDEISQKTTQNEKTIKDVGKRYAELAQEVKGLGKATQSQGTLSTDEYKEFLDISNQLAELYPRLTLGYDENGNAILNLSGDVNTITQSLYDLVDAEKAVASTEMMGKMEKVWEGYEAEISDLISRYNQANDDLATLKAFEPEIMQGKYGLYSLSSRYGDIYKDAGLTDRELEASWDDLSETQQNAIKDAFAKAEKEYDTQIKSLSLQIKSKNKTFADNLITAFQGDELYESLGNYKNIVNGFMANFDYDLLKTNNFEDFADLKKHIIDNFISPLALLMSEGNEDDKNEFQTYYNKLLEIDTEDALAKNIPKIEEYIRKMAEILGVEFNGLAIALGYNLEGDEQKIKTAKERLGYKSSASDVSLFGNSLPSLLAPEEKERNEFIDDVVSDLNDEQLQIVIDNIDIDKVAEIKTKEEFIDYINGLQKDAEIKVRTSVDAVDTFADAKEAITSVDDLWQQTVQNQLKLGKDKKYVDENGNVTKQIDDNNMAVGYADPALINSVEKAFGGIAEEGSKLDDALKAFEETLVKFPGDADKAQEAIDNLITAYIDQSKIIEDLTEDNAEWAEAQLEAMGITNAHEVVQSRLTDTAKKSSKAFVDLCEAVRKYKDVLNEANKGTPEYNAALTDLAGYTSQALTTYDEQGNAYTPDISDHFVEKYLEDIKAMEDGSHAAFERVRLDAAKEAAMDVNIHIPYDVAENQINQLMDYVAQADAMNIDIGASIDDSAFIASLNTMIKSAGLTADQVSAAFESMGYSVQFKQKSAPIRVGSMEQGSKATYIPGTGQTIYWKPQEYEMSFPEVEIITKKSGGGGSVAHYGGSKGSSSSSGGGGGGGGGGSSSEPTKPKDESEEMFDWVEVAIQRLQEAEQRLNKEVGNTYSLWTKRNKNLSDEIQNVTEQIKAQQLAEQEYQKYYNSIQINNGKGLNPDDYGENDELVRQHDQALLDEANRLWATGEYQRKIQQGQLSGDDIEKIANHFLTDVIKEYQEMYNKGVAAKDAAQDLTIQLGELAETKFNNIKSEFDELIAYVTSYADIVDERINRTEEHGYFVSKDYYKQLIAYENQELAYLTNKRADLIKARDEAVAAGYIAKGSSAWNEMNQEILATEKGIEECNTQLVTFNNNIRDIDWEIFDWLEERISRITDEAQFLVDLMSNDQLYEDDGRLTNLGEATNGLYAIQYETLMRQAQDYAEERIKLEREIAKDPANKDLIERYEELVDAQQDVINSAEDMKNAVKDLVEEGILLCPII